MGYWKPREMPLYKGRIIRTFVDHLRWAGLFERVREQVPPGTQAVMDRPPERGEWSDAYHLRYMIEAVGVLEGASAVRRMSRESTTQWWLLFVRPIVQGMMRVFGGSPGTLLSRVDLLTREFSVGHKFEYSEIGQNAGRFEVHSPMPATPMSGEAWAAACESVLDFCGVTGSAVVEELDNRAGHSVTRVRVTWR
jgi:hypothetical protein